MTSSVKINKHFLYIEMVYDINVRGGVMKRIKILFLVSLFLLGGILISSSPPVLSGGISIWPGKLTITMHEGYPEEEIQYEIEVNNLNSYDINVSAEIENPPIHRLKENHTFIPDLSWVSTTPEILHIPAHESRFLEVIITIPDEEKPLHYDERWEVWVVVSEVKDQPSPGTIILIELAVKLFINTPPEKVKQQIPQTLYLISLFIIVGLIVAAMFVFYVKKRERITYKKRPAILYFKKKKGGGSRNNRP
jgi:hypothetical protein